jgi:hypothetical protein
MRECPCAAACLQKASKASPLLLLNSLVACYLGGLRAAEEKVQMRERLLLLRHNSQAGTSTKLTNCARHTIHHLYGRNFFNTSLGIIEYKMCATRAALAKKF